jgi:hypothetical protein
MIVLSAPKKDFGKSPLAAFIIPLSTFTLFEVTSEVDA